MSERGSPWGSLVFGVGTGALVDGFVLHQVLQWHHLWSARRPDSTLAGLEHNTVLDGLFHLTFLAVLVCAAVVLVRRPPGTRTLVAFGLAGWGLFHVVDQLVFHLALDAHHIREGVANPDVYDWSFFAVGVALIAAGGAVSRRARR